MANCTAFEGPRRVASGSVVDVARLVKPHVDRHGKEPILIFDDESSRVVEIDFRGTVDDVAARLSTDETKGPGRPKLGVVGREVTLLPRHWDWLNSQSGGASVALRKLVEEARRANEWKDRARLSQESAYRFLSAMAGNLPGFEEATRALFANNRAKMKREMAAWPADIRQHALQAAAASFTESV